MDKQMKEHECEFCGRKGFGDVFKKEHTPRNCLDNIKNHLIEKKKNMQKNEKK